ncbi:MAG: glycoside hydrolase family 95-like protein [Thermoguttaceae bacterium]
MLLQSRLDLIEGQEVGQLHLLPALPLAWPNGSVKGLGARGGFEVDLVWQQSQLSAARIRSNRSTVCRVRAGQPLTVERGGKAVSTRAVGASWIEFAPAAGFQYEVRPAGSSWNPAPEQPEVQKGRDGP